MSPTPQTPQRTSRRRRQYPWLRLRRGARWPQGQAGRDLCRRLNNVGRDLQRPILITSGQRTAYGQWVAYQDYLRGGTLAASCCWKKYRHSWHVCGKKPTSLHCFGKAADCVVKRRSGELENIGEFPGARESMRHHGLCLPVGAGETWHVQVGVSWAS